MKACGRDYEECSFFILGNVQRPSQSKEPLDRLRVDCSTGIYFSGRRGDGSRNSNSMKALKTVNYLPDNIICLIHTAE